MAQETHRDHGRPRYQKGCACPVCVNAGMSHPCRCPVCVTANRAYSRRNKRLKSANGGQPVAEAPAPPGIRFERDPAKLVETLVAAELESLTAAAAMQGLAAAALAMARVLDDPSSVPQHPSAARMLLQLTLIIRKGSGEGRGVSNIAQRRRAMQDRATA